MGKKCSSAVSLQAVGGKITHRIIELEETTRAIESNPLPSRKHHQSTPDIWLSSLCLKTSKEGDSTTLLGSKFHCQTALTVRKFFLMFRWNLLSCSLDPLLRVRFSGAAENNLSPSSM
ncbi:Hypothetical predicted protein [Podarcis lilfordi]|uniref:Uncharacterized protein n=1 Tax=Podarcis lilfordi TaxID=74358 RepID=A0AA35PGY8_9SAUR|nr:Hypothetical predicted protein [Podarcis lilfordi]